MNVPKGDYLCAIDGNNLLKLSDDHLQKSLAKKRDGRDGWEGDDISLDIVVNPEDYFLEDLQRTKRVCLTVSDGNGYPKP